MKGSDERVDGERGSVQLFMLGLGVAILLLGGISFDLWRLIGERRELAALADSAAIAATSGVDAEFFREQGVSRLDPALVEMQINAVLDQQPPSVLDGLSAPLVTLNTVGCDVTVRFEREFDFALLDFGTASSIVMSATGCASISQG
jgi:uncharacterized membrane protein